MIKPAHFKAFFLVLFLASLTAGKLSSIRAAGPITPYEVPLAREYPSVGRLETRLNFWQREIKVELAQAKGNFLQRINGLSLKKELTQVLDRFFRQFSENASPRMIIVNPPEEPKPSISPIPTLSLTPTPTLALSPTPQPTAIPQPTVTPEPSATPTTAPTPTPTPEPVSDAGYSVEGGRIYRNGEKIFFNGVNWFGFETANNAPHGLWSRNYQEMIAQMKSVGFNAVRIPFCPNTVKNAPVSGIDYFKNPDLEGLGSLEVLDKIVAELEKQEMYFVFDHHRPDCNAISELPTVPGYSESQWIADLVTMTERYQGYQYFMGMDLKNEPHGAATWGTGDSTDWKLSAEKAGKAVLAADPNILVFVEGIQNNSLCSDNSIAHWWGGNLEPQACYPLDLPADRLVLSPHVYGPDVFPQEYFNDSNYPNNLPAIWDKHFGFLAGNYALAIGEWGGKYGAGDPRDVAWQNALADYLAQKGIYSFYWSWNPNSGDTGGILNDDWASVRQDKIQMLQRYAAAFK